MMNSVYVEQATQQPNNALEPAARNWRWRAAAQRWR